MHAPVRDRLAVTGSRGSPPGRLPRSPWGGVGSGSRGGGRTAAGEETSMSGYASTSTIDMNAPAEQVWLALTDPALVIRGWQCGERT